MATSTLQLYYIKKYENRWIVLACSPVLSMSYHIEARIIIMQNDCRYSFKSVLLYLDIIQWASLLLCTVMGATESRLTRAVLRI